MSNVAVKQDNQEDWRFLPIKDFAHTTSGGTPKRGVAEYYNGNVPWVKSGDLNDGYLNKVDEYITELGLEKSSAKLFKPGTLLIALYGATIGRLSILNFEASTNQAVCGISVPDDVDVKYLFYYLLSIRQKLIDQGKGGAQPNINQQIVKATVVPLAPPEQQKRIVAKIEELFSHIDAGIEALKKTKQLLKQYRQSVLKAAVTGELTKEWRETNKDNLEPASQLLKRILKERRQKWEEQQLEQFKAKGKVPKDDKWKEKHKDLENIDVSELDTLPDEWCWAKNEQLGSIQLGRQRSPKYHSGSNMRPYLRVQNVFENKIDLDDVMEMDFSPSDFEKYELKYSDILLNEGQSPELLGRPAIYKNELPGACFTNTLIRFQAADGLLPEYALLVYRYCMHSGRFTKAGTITTNIGHLSAGRFSEIEFPLCCTLEQKEVVKVAEDKFVRIERLEDDIDIQLIKAEKNKQSILASAFSGQFS